MITFHYGAMRGGKSAFLFKLVDVLREESVNVDVFTTIGDSIESRNGRSIFAIPTNGIDFIQWSNSHEGMETIIIDECQFLTEDQVFQLARLPHLNIHVFGIRVTMAGFPFKSSAALLSIADYFHPVTSKCESKGCNRQATMNLLYDEDGNLQRRWVPSTKKIADNRWKSVCPTCYWREFGIG